MTTITLSDFQKVDIRVGKVVEATEVEGSDKLIRQVVDFGDEIGKRVIFSGIKKWYAPSELVGKHLPYVVNLEPRKMMGEKSQGMLVAAAPKDDQEEEYASLLQVGGEVAPGTRVI